GLGEADLPYEALQDPYGIAFWPNFKGRDGCRTPMPWNGDGQAGFTGGEPWLPIADSHRTRSVSLQENDPHSVLNAVRAFLHWRREQPALVAGSIVFLDTPEPVLAFVRQCDPATASGDSLLVVFNLSDAVVQWPLPERMAARAIAAPGVRAGTVAAGMAQLPARGVLYAVLD
ncbi:MAG: alpha-glucosidase, partial [Pseudomonadota bacterium]|nr:alpha-glucosidase [Pseudomonadota bacterium]